jgi:elongation factor G
MDRVGADFHNAVSMMITKLSAHPVVLQLPIGSEDSFSGIIDLVGMHAYSFDESTLGATVIEEGIPEELARSHLSIVND